MAKSRSSGASGQNIKALQENLNAINQKLHDFELASRKTDFSLLKPGDTASFERHIRTPGAYGTVLSISNDRVHLRSEYGSLRHLKKEAYEYHIPKKSKSVIDKLLAQSDAAFAKYKNALKRQS